MTLIAADSGPCVGAELLIYGAVIVRSSLG